MVKKMQKNKNHNLKNDLSKHTEVESYIKEPDMGARVKKRNKVKIKKSSSQISKKP